MRALLLMVAILAMAFSGCMTTGGTQDGMSIIEQAIADTRAALEQAQALVALYIEAAETARDIQEQIEAQRKAMEAAEQVEDLQGQLNYLEQPLRLKGIDVTGGLTLEAPELNGEGE